MYSGFLAGWVGGFFSGFLVTGGLFGAGGGDRLRLEEEEELESLFRAGGSCFWTGLPPLLEDLEELLELLLLTFDLELLEDEDDDDREVLLAGAGGVGDDTAGAGGAGEADFDGTEGAGEGDFDTTGFLGGFFNQTGIGAGGADLQSSSHFSI